MSLTSTCLQIVKTDKEKEKIHIHSHISLIISLVVYKYTLIFQYLKIHQKYSILQLDLRVYIEHKLIFHKYSSKYTSQASIQTRCRVEGVGLRVEEV